MFRVSIAIACVASLLASPAFAQNFPNKPIRLIIGFAPGGGTDITARAITQRLSEKFGQPIVVDYRPGAGGTVGNAIAAKTSPDGYTWLMTATGPHVIAPSLYRNLTYDIFRDYAPIAMVSIGPYLLLVHPSVEAQNVADLVRWLRNRTTPASYSTAGVGTPSHLATELFKNLAKVQITHVPYKGASPALIDLLGGQIQLAFSDMLIAAPHLTSGRLRALAITSSARSPLAPNLPTVAESGFPGFEALVWYGLLGPAGTPPSVVRYVNAEVVRILNLADTKERYAALGATASPGSPEDFAAQIKRDFDRYAGVIKSAGIKVE